MFPQRLSIFHFSSVGVTTHGAQPSKLVGTPGVCGEGPGSFWARGGVGPQAGPAPKEMRAEGQAWHRSEANLYPRER